MPFAMSKKVGLDLSAKGVRMCATAGNTSAPARVLSPGQVGTKRTTNQPALHELRVCGIGSFQGSSSTSLPDPSGRRLFYLFGENRPTGRFCPFCGSGYARCRALPTLDGVVFVFIPTTPARAFGAVQTAPMLQMKAGDTPG